MPEVAKSLSNLGDIGSATGAFVAARGQYEESLALSRRLGNAQGVAVLLNNLG